MMLVEQRSKAVHGWGDSALTSAEPTDCLPYVGRLVPLGHHRGHNNNTAYLIYK